MKNKQKVADWSVFAFVMMLVIMLVQYALDANGATRAYYQWWTNWSGIDFVGMLDYMYNSVLYQICAWTAVIAASVWSGILVRQLFVMRIA